MWWILLLAAGASGLPDFRIPNFYISKMQPQEDLYSSSGLQGLDKLVIKEVQVNMAAQVKFACKLLMEMEILVEGPELKRLLNSINSDLNDMQYPICKDPEKFASQSPDNYRGLNIEEVRAKQFKEFTDIFMKHRRNSMNNDLSDVFQEFQQNSGGMMPLMIHEALTNFKMHAYVCLIKDEYIAVTKTKELKDYLKGFIKLILEPTCNTPDTIRIQKEVRRILHKAGNEENIVSNALVVPRAQSLVSNGNDTEVKANVRNSNAELSSDVALVTVTLLVLFMELRTS